MPIWKFMLHLNRHVLPDVHRELESWKARAAVIPDPELRHQALASIEHKAFHCEGGSVYAAAAVDKRYLLIPLIVAFQTISDYLDNLCDRSTTLAAEDFTCLHQAILDAVTPEAPLHDYYVFRKKHNEPSEDGGYLQSLVLACRGQIALFPGYSLVQEQIIEWAGLYSDLQVYKHIEPKVRESTLIAWWKDKQELACGLPWNEFAAATGSTLGIFAMFLEALQPSVASDSVARLQRAYFPWIGAVHILLDYLVDYEEDRLGGDLNFLSYYLNRNQALERLQWIANRAREEARNLKDISEIHAIAVDGLFGMYLADGKVNRHALIASMAKSLLRKSSFRSKFFYLFSKWHRGSQVHVQEPRIDHL